MSKKQHFLYFDVSICLPCINLESSRMSKNSHFLYFDVSICLPCINPDPYEAPVSKMLRQRPQIEYMKRSRGAGINIVSPRIS